MYSARISRNSPAAFIILIDQSGSMAETVVIDRKEVVKAKAVAFIVNMLIAELLNRSRREEGYRDYFDIAVLGYHGDEVASLWKNPNRMFMRPNDLITRVRDNILKSKEQKNIQPTKGGHKMVTCQNYVSLFYRQITSCPSDGGIS